MRDRPRTRSRLARVCEVGIAGIARRVRDRAKAPGRARRRVVWQSAFAQPGTISALLAQLDPRSVSAAATGAVSPDVALAAVRDGIGGGGHRFFLDASDARLRSSFAARHAAAAKRLVAQADAARRGDLAWIVPGGRSDWHAALPGDGRWPLVTPQRTGLDAEMPLGDVRLAWEVGRCTHALRLAQAAWITGEGAYAEVVVELLRDFASKNPPGQGIAWAHAQEAAIRAVTWLWAFHLTRPFGVFDVAAFHLWLWLLLAHGEYIAAFLSEHPVTHNHLISEAAALVVLGTALPELRAARSWRRIGTRLLWREVRKQIDDEGVAGEHSTHYHAFVLDSCLAALLLTNKAPARVRERIGGMADYVAALIGVDGTLPAIGDTDAGRAWRFGEDPLDRRDVLAAAAVAFGRADWGAIAGDAAGAFWLTGGRSVPGAGAAPPRGFARRYEAEGIGVARTGYSADAEFLLFRAGPTRFRPDVLASHAHADALSLVWRVGADDVLVDPGTWLYSEHEGWRAWLRGTAAHSCVIVDRRNQADVSKRFGIAELRPARWLYWQGNAERLVAAAEHPTGRSPLVRRRIAWVRGGLLVLCDDVLGDGEHRVEGWLQTPAATAEAEGATASLRLASGRTLLVQGLGDIANAEVLRPHSDAGPGPGWLAPRYGKRVAGAAVRLDRGTCRLPARLVTLLQVGDGDTAPERGRWERTVDGGFAVHARQHTVTFSADGRTSIEDPA